jgi:signal peptidase I
MKTHTRWYHAVAAAVLLVGMATAWIIFAPMQLGGQAGYIIVNGNSMEPLYKRGDLVIVRQEAEYQIGDIVTYHHPDIGPVIHRIIGRVGDRYLLKGDHNTWTDSYLPGGGDIIGKAWIHVPGLGQIFMDLRSPWSLSILVACAAALLLFTVIPSPGGARTRRDRPQRKGQQFPMKIFFEKREDWLFVLAAFALSALLLGGVAFTHPLTRTVTTDIQYKQTGVFSYSAVVPGNPHIYDFPDVRTGEPVYSQLSNHVNFRFDYQIVSDSPVQVQGSVRLDTQVSAEDGWQQTLESQPAAAFSGATASVAGTMDLVQIQTVLNNLQTRTGVQRQIYTVSIKPQVLVAGTIGGEAVAESFAPILEFQVDPFEMQLIRTDSSGNDALAPNAARTINGLSSQPNTLPILGLQLQVLTARWVSIIVLVLSLAGLSLLGFFVYRNTKTEPEPARIQHKYEALLVSVPGHQPRRGEQVINVETIDDLARLAEKDGRLILHTEKKGQHFYFVQDTSLVYRFVTPGDYKGQANQTAAGKSGSARPRHRPDPLAFLRHRLAMDVEQPDPGPRVHSLPDKEKTR